MKVAIVHDWLANMGGAERIILIMHRIFPEAPVYTLVHNPDRLPDEFREIDVRTSFIQKLPFGQTKYQNYLPLFPTAIEQFDLSGFDLVLSSSTSAAKGVITRADTLHVCYCATPMRYAWDFYHEYLHETGGIKRLLMPWFMNYIRLWDRLSADRVDRFIANSVNVARRIAKHYRREATVIHPPVDCRAFRMAEAEGEYFLVVSRLVPYKRVDLAVEACNRLHLPLKVIGDGSEYRRLKAQAGPTVEFLGRLPDAEVAGYYSGCKAFLFPGEEDFGITPLEAQACGRPVIAFGRGGALETVVPGETGLFFPEQTAESLAEAIKAFEKLPFERKKIRRHAETFDNAVFMEKLQSYVLAEYAKFQAR